MADVQEKLRVARAHLNVLMRRHREIGAGFLPPSATLDAQINQALDEVECLEYEAAMLAYPYFGGRKSTSIKPCRLLPTSRSYPETSVLSRRLTLRPPSSPRGRRRVSTSEGAQCLVW